MHRFAVASMARGLVSAVFEADAGQPSARPFSGGQDRDAGLQPAAGEFVKSTPYSSPKIPAVDAAVGDHSGMPPRQHSSVLAA